MHWYDISLCTQHYLIHRSDAHAFVFAGSVVYLPNLCSLVVRPQITLCPRGYGHGLVSEQSLVTGHFCTCFQTSLSDVQEDVMSCCIICYCLRN